MRMRRSLLRLIKRLRRSFAWIEASELKRRLDHGEAVTIVDVRGPDEFTGSLGHIATARNIPVVELAVRRPCVQRHSLAMRAHRLRRRVHPACISNDPSFDLNPELGKSTNYLLPAAGAGEQGCRRVFRVGARRSCAAMIPLCDRHTAWPDRSCTHLHIGFVLNV